MLNRLPVWASTRLKSPKYVACDHGKSLLEIEGFKYEVCVFPDINRAR